MADLKTVACPKYGKQIDVTARSTAWCSDRHPSTLMRPVHKEHRHAS